MPYVLPTPLPAVIEDLDLDRIFQANLVGITGLPGRLVRPRWQPEPPNQPDFTENWAALGVTATEADTFAFIRQVDAATVELERDQFITVLVSFYGPASGNYLGLYRDGLSVQLNRLSLTEAGIKLIEVGKARQLPALLKEKWMKRQDIQVEFARRIRRLYTLASINTLDMGLDNEYYITPIIVNPPTP